MEISLRDYGEKEMYIALKPKLILKMILEANATGLLSGEVEDIILIQRSNGTWGYRLVNRKAGEN